MNPNQHKLPAHPKVVAIIQARMAASRLPGKVLLDIAGQPMLARVVERTRRARTISQVVVATTTDSSDDAVQAFCEQHSYLLARGSQYDVLDRYYQAAVQFQADGIVRITADCPLIDPGMIDLVVDTFLASYATDQPYDFVANRLPPPWERTIPIGLDTEVVSFQALETAWQQATEPHQREHVMPYFYEQPGRFHILHLTNEPNYGNLRWTVDTPQDLELARQIYARFLGRDDFTWQEVLALLQDEPGLAQVNNGVPAKDYRQVDARRGEAAEG